MDPRKVKDKIFRWVCIIPTSAVCWREGRVGSAQDATLWMTERRDDAVRDAGLIRQTRNARVD